MNDKLIKLYFALESIRKTKEFKHYGLAKGGPFNFFVKDLKTIRHAKVDRDLNEIIIDLDQLAIRYAFKRGRKDKVTRLLSREILTYLGIKYRPAWRVWLNL